jgi:hypothetical protein
VAGWMENGREGNGGDVERRQRESSSTSYLRRLEEGSGTPGTSRHPRARPAPASSNQEVT